MTEGDVQWVDFYQDNRLIGWAEQEPFTFEWTGLTPGNYLVAARATDSSGQTVVSAPVVFNVVGQSPIALTRGPYIMMGHQPGQSTIVWRTEPAADSWVEYGLTSAYGFVVGSVSLVQQHEVTLMHLLPGRTYHYRIRSAGQVLAAAEFRSAKSPGTPVRIAWLADHRGGTAGPLAEVIKSYKPDLMLDAGDLMDWCNEGVLDVQFFSVFAPVMRQSPLYWTPGNHEYTGCAPCLEAFDLLPEDHQSYSIEYGDLQAVALNAMQLPPPDWLREKLAGSDKPWKFVFTHVPSYSAYGGHGEWEGTEIRTHYVPLMEEYKVAACITGHSHYYWRSQPIRGVTHLVVGSGGAPRYNLGELPPYTAAGYDTADAFAYADIDGDFMHIHAVDQFNNQVDETLIDRRCAFELDGVLDSSAFPVSECSGGLSLWAAVAGRYLYVATTNAIDQDHFIFLSRTLSGEMTNLGPVWGKSGQVTKYDAFLAGEGSSMDSGWFDQAGQPFGNLRVARSTTRISKDGVLEGVIDLKAVYGSIPPVLYLAAAPYDMNPDGWLNATRQCPSGNQDEVIQADEMAVIDTGSITLEVGKFVGFHLATDGSIALDFAGDPNSAHVIEASTDFHDWHPISNAVADAGGRFTFSDPAASLSKQRFYRTRPGAASL